MDGKIYKATVMAPSICGTSIVTMMLRGSTPTMVGLTTSGIRAIAFSSSRATHFFLPCFGRGVFYISETHLTKVYTIYTTVDLVYREVRHRVLPYHSFGRSSYPVLQRKVKRDRIFDESCSGKWYTRVMNKKSLYFPIIFIPLIGLGMYAYHYFGGGEKAMSPGETVVMNASDTYNAEHKEKEPVEIVIEEVAGGLEVPWSIAFTSPTRMLITERPGRVRAVVDGELLETPLYIFAEVSTTGEEGLMGLALDPHYDQNHFIYVSYAYNEGSKLQVRVVRLTDSGESLIDPLTLLEGIPAAQYHAGSRIAFGPDQLLYVTTGDATNKNIAQDQKSLGGKILRMNKDGSVPEDNPFEGSLVYSYGHRNSQGLAWNPENNELYATEHGPSILDGPAGGDEINHILPGENYGWPLVSHKEKKEGTEKPMLLFTPAVAPGGATFYTGSKIPQFTGKLFFAGLKGEGVYEVEIDEDDPNDVKSYEKLGGVDFGRIRDIVEGPDEALYFLTSNRDGRGKALTGDDKVYRIRAK